jgi:hypothetical protein
MHAAAERAPKRAPRLAARSTAPLLRDGDRVVDVDLAVVALGLLDDRVSALCAASLAQLVSCGQGSPGTCQRAHARSVVWAGLRRCCAMRRAGAVWWRGSPVAEVVAIGSIDAGLSLSKLPRSGAATGIAAAAPAAADSSSCGRRNELGQQGSWRWVLPSTVHEAASHARWHMGRWWVGDVPDSVAPPSVRVAEERDGLY